MTPPTDKTYWIDVKRGRLVVPPDVTQTVTGVLSPRFQRTDGWRAIPTAEMAGAKQ